MTGQDRSWEVSVDEGHPTVLQFPNLLAFLSNGRVVNTGEELPSVPAHFAAGPGNDL